MQRRAHTVAGRVPTRSRIALGLVAVIACLALAACGSSSNSSNSSTGGSAATTATSGATTSGATTSGATTSAGTSTSGGSSSGGSGLAAAKAEVTKYSQTPKQITVSKPVGKAVPSGKTIDFVDCGIPTCTAVGNSLKQAGAALGWSYTSIPADTTPAGAQKGFEQAIQNKPDAVAYTGLARADINPQLKQLAALHIPVVTCCTTDKTGAGLTGIVRGAASSAASGKLAAAFIVNDSGGKANTLYVDLPVFPIYVPYRTSFASNYKKYCPSCGLSTLSLSATAIGSTGPTQIANYLASHKSINYVFVVNDALSLGLNAAMKAAGVTNVKYVGSDSTQANFPSVVDGQELATIPSPVGETGWYLADMLSRAFVGEPQINEGNMELQVWTKGTIPPGSTKAGTIIFNPDFMSQFKKLWGK
jgi:ABC-type sugar transport system substrate-binding protein